MRNIGKLVAVVAVLAVMALGPSMAMAAPIQHGTPGESGASVGPSLFSQFLRLMGAIWGGGNRGSSVTPDGAIWGRCTGVGCA